MANEPSAYDIGREQAIQDVKNLLQRGPMAASISAAEFRRGYNEVIKAALKGATPRDPS